MSCKEDYSQGDNLIRCVCDYTHDDGYTIQCDKCNVWQHSFCVEISASTEPEEYFCDRCDPREFDLARANKRQKKVLRDLTKQWERSRKSSRGLTQNSSAAPSPSASSSVRVVKKRGRKPSGVGGPANVFNFSPSASVSAHDVEDLMARVCQGLLTSKIQGRKNPSTSGSPKHISGALNYTLCPSSSTFEADLGDILVLDRNHIDAGLADVNVRDIEGVGRKKQGRRNNVGLFACTSVPVGQLIVEVTGKVILRSQYTQEPSNMFNLMGTVLPDVVLHRPLNLAVDCREKPCLASHIRRHCKPNAELRSFFIEHIDTDVVHLGVFSTAPIEPDQEILLPWTLSAELLPNGLTKVEDEVEFKHMIGKAFHRAYSHANRTLTQDQAKLVIRCLRQDNCPCRQEPPCLINRFFRVRKVFWSRHKLTALAGNEAPPPPPVQMVPDEKKPLSGSETEMDSSANMRLAARRATREPSPIDENSSPIQILEETATPPAPDSAQQDTRPSPPPLIKSCHPSSPADIPKSPASPLPPLPAPLPSCAALRRDQLREMSLIKYFMAKYNSEHGIKPKEEVFQRPTPPRSSATESEPVPHTSPPQTSPGATPQVVTEKVPLQLASPKKLTPSAELPARHKSPAERPQARLTPRKGHRLSWKQFIIDPKDEAQFTSFQKPSNGYPKEVLHSNGHSKGHLHQNGQPKEFPHKNGQAKEFISNEHAKEFIHSNGRPKDGIHLNGQPKDFSHPSGKGISFRRASGVARRVSRSPSPARARLKETPSTVHQPSAKSEDFPRKSALSHLSTTRPNAYSEAEEGELSNYSDSPLPDHSLQNQNRQLFAPSARPHPTRHPSLDSKDEPRFHYYNNNDRFASPYSYSREATDQEHMRNRPGQRYIPPISPSGYRSEDRGVYHGHHRDPPHNRRDRAWNVESPLGYQSPSTVPGTPRSEHHNNGPYIPQGQGYRSNSNLSHNPSFYQNSRSAPQSQPPSHHHVIASNPNSLPASRDMEP